MKSLGLVAVFLCAIGIPLHATRRKRGRASPARSPISKDPWCRASRSQRSTHDQRDHRGGHQRQWCLHDSAAAARAVPLTAALEGFKTYSRDGIELHTAETVSVNVQLPIGAREEIVTVSAGQSAIESNESTIAQTIENKRISELPLNGRQVYMLMQLTAGTLFTQTTFGATGFSGTRAWDVNGSLSVHGSRTGNNEFLIDGAPSAGTGGGTGNWNFAPPVDAIEEFKIGTSSVDASFGRTSGGVINMTLRSGTNQLRGSGHRPAPRHLARRQSDPEHPQQHLERRPQVLQRRGHAERADRPQQDLLHGRLPGVLREHPVPGDANGPDRGAAARRLLADDHRQRHADRHLRSGDDRVQRATSARARDSRSRATSFPRTAGIRSRRRCCRTFRGRTRPRATSPGSSNFISSPNIGRYRYNSYLDAHRPHLQPEPSAVGQQQRQLGHRVPQRERAARTGDPQRQLPDPSQSLPGDGRRQLHHQLVDPVEHSRLVGPLRRAARQDLRRHRPAAAVHRPLPADRTALPADQPERLRRHVPADVPAAEERRLLGQQQRLENDGASTSSRPAASSARISSTASTR